MLLRLFSSQGGGWGGSSGIWWWLNLEDLTSQMLAYMLERVLPHPHHMGIICKLTVEARVNSAAFCTVGLSV